IGPYYQLYLYAILGLGAGGISLLYIRYSERLYHLFRRRILARIPQWLVMTLVGLTVGVCGYFYPQIFGIGYQAINRILAQELTWQVVAVLLVMKFVLVPLILHSGGFGGIFAPSLFMGACFGFLYATGLNELLGLSVDVTTFVLVAMGAVLGGINSIPISAILILFEMSRDYALILPLMLAVVISTTLVQLVIKGSIYSVHLSEQGYHIARGHEAAVLRSIQVKSVMREDVALIPEHLPLPQLIRELIESPHSTFYVVNGEGRLSGIITESELRPIITEYENLRAMLVAGDIARPDVVTVREDDDLDHVLKLFGQENVDEFPVVSSDNPDKVIGSIWRQDVIAAYNRESLKYNLADELAHDLKALRKAQTVPVADGYSIIERPVPKRFVGKTLAELRLRNKYGLEVLMIRHGSPLFSEEDEDGDFVIPTANYVLREGDRLVLFGKDEAIAGAKRWR
ncbi:MAG: CBS domain-containing protein, partial [Calditrichaeota bacterium]